LSSFYQNILEIGTCIRIQFFQLFYLNHIDKQLETLYSNNLLDQAKENILTQNVDKKSH